MQEVVCPPLCEAVVVSSRRNVLFRWFGRWAFSYNVLHRHTDNKLVAMVDELEELWKKLTFMEEEDTSIKLDSSSTNAARKVGKYCAVIKILSQRSINVDALRKNLRMLWKPNKGVQISELEEDLYLVEFKDEKDKRKVLDMCPWSYEKQLVLIQEFEGRLTPKEIEVK